MRRVTVRHLGHLVSDAESSPDGDELAVEDDWPAPHAQVPLWIVLSGISSRAVHEYAFLFAHTNPERDGRRVAFPGQRAIAKVLGLATSKPERVKPFTDELIAIGALRVEEVTTYMGRAYRYILRYNPPPGWQDPGNLAQWYDANPDARSRTPKSVAVSPPERPGGSPQIWGDGSPQKRGDGSPRIWGANYNNKNYKKEKGHGGDAVGQGAGGLAGAGARTTGAKGSGKAASGSAASGQIPSPRKSTPPKTVKTQPRKLAAGYELVRAAMPTEVAQPGTELWVGLRRAIADLLTGSAGMPRTPEQVIARINRLWHQPRSEDAEPIHNPQSWLAKAILTQDCPDPGCEDGTLLYSGQSCPACDERRAEHASAKRATAEAARRWEQEIREGNTAADDEPPAPEDHEPDPDAWTLPDRGPAQRCLSCTTPYYGVNLLGLCGDCAREARGAA